MQAYAREQRPLLSEGRSPGERQKFLSQRWKVLSKAEKAHYQGCEGTTQTPSRLAYSFAQELWHLCRRDREPRSFGPPARSSVRRSEYDYT